MNSDSKHDKNNLIEYTDFNYFKILKVIHYI